MFNEVGNQDIQPKPFIPLSPVLRSDSNIMQDIFRQNEISYEIKIDHNSIIGAGGQGRVYKAEMIVYSTERTISDRYQCVAKILHSSFSNERRDSIIEADIHEILSANGHSSSEMGILKLIGNYIHIQDDGSVFIYAIMPRCDAILAGCNTAFESLKHDDPALFQHVFFDLFSSLINSLKHLKAKNIAHRDIKPANIGFRHRWLLLDFGISVQCGANGSPQTPIDGGTAKYCAPELQITDVNDPSGTIDLFAGDVFSTGVVLEEYFWGAGLVQEPIFHTPQCFVETESSESTLEQLKFVTQNRLREAINRCLTFDEAVATTILSMKKPYAHERPTIETLHYIETKLYQLFIHPQQSEKLNAFYSQMVITSQNNNISEREPIAIVNTDEIFSIRVNNTHLGLLFKPHTPKKSQMWEPLAKDRPLGPY